MLLPYSTEEVRARMLSAWDGVESLHAQALTKAYPIRTEPPYNGPEFLTCEDGERLCPRRYEAWWQGPDCWRHEYESGLRTWVSYLAKGDAWWVKNDGKIVLQGTVSESQQGLRAQGENLISGRPYLPASENRFLWAWINPQLWAASLGMIVLDGSDADDVYHKSSVVHVLAGQWSTGRASLAVQKKWPLTNWDRDPEVLDDTNFCQLWVDMRTGFCRRITGEGANGRSWDILLDVPVINQAGGIDRAMFHP